MSWQQGDKACARLKRVALHSPAHAVLATTLSGLHLAGAAGSGGGKKARRTAAGGLRVAVVVHTSGAVSVFHGGTLALLGAWADALPPAATADLLHCSATAVGGRRSNGGYHDGSASESGVGDAGDTAQLRLAKTAAAGGGSVAGGGALAAALAKLDRSEEAAHAAAAESSPSSPSPLALSMLGAPTPVGAAGCGAGALNAAAGGAMVRVLLKGQAPGAPCALYTLRVLVAGAAQAAQAAAEPLLLLERTAVAFLDAPAGAGLAPACADVCGRALCLMWAAGGSDVLDVWQLGGASPALLARRPLDGPTASHACCALARGHVGLVSRGGSGGGAVAVLDALHGVVVAAEAVADLAAVPRVAAVSAGAHCRAAGGGGPFAVLALFHPPGNQAAGDTAAAAPTPSKSTKKTKKGAAAAPASAASVRLVALTAREASGGPAPGTLAAALVASRGALAAAHGASHGADPFNAPAGVVVAAHSPAAASLLFDHAACDGAAAAEEVLGLHAAQDSALAAALAAAAAAGDGAAFAAAYGRCLAAASPLISPGGPGAAAAVASAATIAAAASAKEEEEKKKKKTRKRKSLDGFSTASGDDLAEAASDEPVLAELVGPFEARVTACRALGEKTMACLVAAAAALLLPASSSSSPFSSSSASSSSSPAAGCLFDLIASRRLSGRAALAVPAACSGSGAGGGFVRLRLASLLLGLGQWGLLEAACAAVPDLPEGDAVACLQTLAGRMTDAEVAAAAASCGARVAPATFASASAAAAGVASGKKKTRKAAAAAAADGGASASAGASSGGDAARLRALLVERLVASACGGGTRSGAFLRAASRQLDAGEAAVVVHVLRSLLRRASQGEATVGAAVGGCEEGGHVPAWHAPVAVPRVEAVAAWCSALLDAHFASLVTTTTTSSSSSFSAAAAAPASGSETGAEVGAASTASLLGPALWGLRELVVSAVGSLDDCADSAARLLDAMAASREATVARATRAAQLVARPGDIAGSSASFGGGGGGGDLAGEGFSGGAPADYSVEFLCI